MKLSNTAQLEAKVETMTRDRGVPYKVLRVSEAYDPEVYNQHRLIREGSNGSYIIAEKPYSLHQEDFYLVYVLAFYEGQYVTWYENLDCNGFYGGHYYAADFMSAFRDFTERGTYREFDPETGTRVTLEITTQIN